MPVVLETRRLTLRSAEPADLDAMQALYGDEETMRWIGAGDGVRTREQTARGIRRMIEHQESHGYSIWAVVDRSSGEVIGNCGLVLVEWEGPDVELAYMIRRDRWGEGIATEAAAASLKHGLGPLGLERVIGLAYPENVASHRVMEKAGMTRIGMVTAYGARMVRFEATSQGG
jgi:[ribosomal protein S5]-alanine N-acetyltransferase